MVAPWWLLTFFISFKKQVLIIQGYDGEMRTISANPWDNVMYGEIPNLWFTYIDHREYP